MNEGSPKPPEALNRFVRTVLSYHPKPKSQPAKKRQRLARASRRAGQPAKQRPDK